MPSSTLARSAFPKRRAMMTPKISPLIRLPPNGQATARVSRSSKAPTKAKTAGLSSNANTNGQFTLALFGSAGWLVSDTGGSILLQGQTADKKDSQGNHRDQ